MSVLRVVQMTRPLGGKSVGSIGWMPPR